MTVTITGFSFNNGELHLFAENTEDYNLQILERNRYDDGSADELEFIFTASDTQYLYSWLHRQKAVTKAEPKSLGEAVRAAVGIVTNLSTKYLNFDPTY